MHPEVRQAKAGFCPKCGMALEVGGNQTIVDLLWTALGNQFAGG